VSGAASADGTGEMGPVLEIRDASKRFGAVTAVDGVSLRLGRGEVLAVLGDNGAGKSTLIKCISGAHRLDEGSIEIDGSPVSLRSPTEARRHGIETVYQDLALFDDLDVVANLFAGHELIAPSRPRFGGWLKVRQMRRLAAQTLDDLGVRIPSLQAPVKLLSGGQRQAIAVARAVHFASKVVILDEPTAALGVRETANVQRLVERLPERGISVILISHNLDQVAEVADRAIVLRRGGVVGEAIPDSGNHDRIVSMIVGAKTATKG
jgi:ABC-type sugar transport system ATPase subunit